MRRYLKSKNEEKKRDRGIGLDSEKEEDEETGKKETRGEKASGKVVDSEKLRKVF